MDTRKTQEIQRLLQKRFHIDEMIWTGFTGRYVVMSIFHKIPIDLDEVFDDEKLMQQYEVVMPVYLVPNERELVRKIRRKQIPFEICDIGPMLHIYKKYLLKTPFDYYLLNTAYKTVNECAKLIYEEYKRREKNT